MEKALPLTGIKVVELATVVAAPMVGRMMSDYGAETIKIETPPMGDLLRPISIGQSFPAEDYNSPLFDLMNSGKKLISINLKTKEGMEALSRLLEDTDVFLSNVRMRSLEKMGLGYEDLKKRFPRLIYAHLSGFGLEGPDADRPGFDATTFWLRTGASVDYLVPGSVPMHPPFGAGDIATASALLSGVMMALYARNTTNKGSEVTTSLFGSGLWCNASAVLNAQPQYGKEYPVDRYTPWDPLSDYYLTSDGEWIAVFEKRYEVDRPKFAKIFDMPELEEDPDFETLEKMRTSGKTAYVTHKVEEAIRTKTADEWQEILTELDIPNERAAHFKDMYLSEQAWQNDCFEEVEYPGEVKTAMPVPPIQFSEYGRKPVKKEGGIGCDTDEVFLQLGYNAEEIKKMHEQKVIM